MSTLTLVERAQAYQQTFPQYPQMWVDKGWLMGVWVLGQLYRRERADYYGAYPGNYLKRVLALFPDCPAPLHLFSGTVKHGVTVDKNIALCPSVVADAHALPFQEGAFQLVIADPPYSPKDAEQYGFRMVNRHRVLKGVRRVVSCGGHCAWLDTVRPMYSKLEWKQVGAVMVTVSTNTRTRQLAIFQAV